MQPLFFLQIFTYTSADTYAIDIKLFSVAACGMPILASLLRNDRKSKK